MCDDCKWQSGRSNVVCAWECIASGIKLSTLLPTSSDDSSTIITAYDENSSSEMSTTVYGLSALTSLVRLSTLLHAKGRAIRKPRRPDHLLYLTVRPRSGDRAEDDW